MAYHYNCMDGAAQHVIAPLTHCNRDGVACHEENTKMLSQKRGEKMWDFVFGHRRNEAKELSRIFGISIAETRRDMKAHETRPEAPGWTRRHVGNDYYLNRMFHVD